MNIATHNHENCLIAIPKGRIDQLSAVEFQTAILDYVNQCQQAQRSLILDFHNVDYMSSVGLRALMIVSRQCKTMKVGLAICSLQPIVKEVFDIARFNLVVKYFGSIEEASQALIS